MEIPHRIRAYAEVVVDRATGVAHRVGAHKTVVRQSARWDGTEMVPVDVYGWSWYPRCMTAPEPGGPAPHTYAMSAAWAHMLGHPGCPQCWPGEQAPGTPGEQE